MSHRQTWCGGLASDGWICGDGCRTAGNGGAAGRWRLTSVSLRIVVSMAD